MSTYDNVLPPTRLDRAIDAAVEAENRAYLADQDAQARDAAAADAWRHLMDAEQTVGEHGVVLPAALARDLLRALKGEDTVLSHSMLQKMLTGHLDKATARGLTSQEG